jgi:flagellar hook-basal body complex protein FliE
MQISGSLPVAEIAQAAKVGPVKMPDAAESNFGDILKDTVNEVNKLQAGANSKIGELLSGNAQDVHSAMISVQEANLSFDLMVQVRNKMVSAYQEISRLQF